MLTKQEILQLVLDGVPYAEAVLQFPELLRGTYLRFGGKDSKGAPGPPLGAMAQRKSENLLQKEERSLEEIMFLQARTFSFSEKVQRKVVYDSLFGDGCLTQDPYLLEAHAFSQAPYLWSKAALLGGKVSSLRFYNRNGKSPQEDTMLSLRTVTSPRVGGYPQVIL